MYVLESSHDLTFSFPSAFSVLNFTARLFSSLTLTSPNILPSNNTFTVSCKSSVENINETIILEQKLCTPTHSDILLPFPPSTPNTHTHTLYPTTIVTIHIGYIYIHTCTNSFVVSDRCSKWCHSK